MMVSACINTAVASPEIILDFPPACPSYAWLSPRISFTRDSADDRASAATGNPGPGPAPAGSREKPNPDAFADFEFLPDDPVAMLPADELFSGGKLVPFQLTPAPLAADEILPPESARAEAHRPDVPSPSPRAPRCSSRLRELLGLKRQQQGSKADRQTAVASAGSKNPNPRSLKQFLRRDSKSPSTDPSLSVPLLRDSESEPVSLSSRSRSSLSSSSSSSGLDHEDIRRLSLDTDKRHRIPFYHGQNPHPPMVRVSRPRSATAERHPAARTGRSPVRRTPPEAAAAPRGASMGSPRMSASGRVVFERSSSSPGSFNGGPRVLHYGMERSYSSGVRFAPVLNVPVFGLGQFFWKDREGPPEPPPASGARSRGRVGNEKKKKKTKSIQLISFV